MLVAIEHSQRMSPKVSARWSGKTSALMRSKKPFRLVTEDKPPPESCSLAELHWKNQGGGWKKSSGREAGLTTPEYTQLKNPSTEEGGKTPE